MSRSAYLVCEDTKEMICLGKITTPPDSAVSFGFWHGEGREIVLKAIIKFLGMNMGKVIRVLPEEDMDDYDESYRIIGHDAAMGPLMSDYIKDFPK